jgi:hypothetical protein
MYYTCICIVAVNFFSKLLGVHLYTHVHILCPPVELGQPQDALHGHLGEGRLRDYRASALPQETTERSSVHVLEHECGLATGPAEQGVEVDNVRRPAARSSILASCTAQRAGHRYAGSGEHPLLCCLDSAHGFSFVWE